MNALELLRDIRVRETRLMSLIAEMARKDKAISSAYLNYSFDVQERLREFDDAMAASLNEGFLENTSSLFRLNIKIQTTEDYDAKVTNIDFSPKKNQLTQHGKIIFAIRAEERKLLLLLRELAVNWPDALRVNCNVSAEDAAALASFPVDCLMEIAYQECTGTIFRLKFDTKKKITELMSWINQPAALGLLLDRAS